MIFGPFGRYAAIPSRFSSKILFSHGKRCLSLSPICASRAEELLDIQNQVEKLFNQIRLSTVTELLNLNESNLLKLRTKRALKGSINIYDIEELGLLDDENAVHILRDHITQTNLKFQSKSMLAKFIKSPQSQSVTSAVTIDYNMENIFWSLLDNNQQVKLIGSISMGNLTKNIEEFIMACRGLISTLPSADVYLVRTPRQVIGSLVSDRVKTSLSISHMISNCIYSTLLLESKLTDQNQLKNYYADSQSKSTNTDSHLFKNSKSPLIFQYPIDLALTLSGMPEIGNQRTIINEIKMSYLFNPQNELSEISKFKAIERIKSTPNDDVFFQERNLFTKDLIDNFITKRPLSPFFTEVLNRNTNFLSFYRYCNEFKFSENSNIAYHSIFHKSVISESIWYNMVFWYYLNTHANTLEKQQKTL